MTTVLSTPATISAASSQRLLSAVVVGMLLLLCNCSGDGAGPSSGRGAGAGRGGGRQDPPTAVAAEMVARGTVVSRYTTTATLEADNRAVIQARTSGVVERLFVEEGDLVNADQELLRLDDQEAQLRLRQAEVEVAEQRTVFERQKASREREIIPQADYDLAKASLEAAEANRDLADHELSYTRVRAPFRGTIVARQVDVGQTANPGMPLFEIANFNPLLARVHVPSKEMGTLQVGQDVELTLDSSNETLRGQVRLISPVVDTNTGTVKVTVEILDYPKGTRPGDFAHVSVVTERHENVLKVPNIAVFEDKGEQIVYVAQDSIAARRIVEVGFTDDMHTEIIAGLDEGEMVIVKGQRSLKDGGRIRILEADAGVANDERASAQRREGT